MRRQVGFTPGDFSEEAGVDKLKCLIYSSTASYFQNSAKVARLSVGGKMQMEVVDVEE